MGKLTKTFIRNEDNVKFIPRWFIIVELISVFLTAVLAICILVALITGNMKLVMCEGIILGVILIGSFIADKLDWCHNVTYKFNNKGLTYSYNLDNSLILTSNSQVDIKVVSVSDIKEHHNGDITLKGELEKRAPMSKPRSITKFRFKNIPEHHDEIVAGMKNLLG